MAKSDGPLIVGLGEALFDCFPDREVLGGAPVNVVVHANALLKPLGGSAIPATRVGDDELGRRFLAELEQRRIDASTVQVDPKRPTGTVEVRPRDDAETEYVFASNTAWDHLASTDAWLDLARRCDAACFGTLAQRSPESRVTIEAFASKATNAIRLLDVNIRQNFYTREILDQSLRAATAAKLNAEELRVVTGELELSADASSLIEAYNLDWVAVTNGPGGTNLFIDGGSVTAEVPVFESLPGADSVGAGDACSAGLLFGMLRGWPAEQTVELANRLGAFVASQPGATPAIPDSLLNDWL